MLTSELQGRPDRRQRVDREELREARDPRRLLEKRLGSKPVGGQKAHGRSRISNGRDIDGRSVVARTIVTSRTPSSPMARDRVEDRRLAATARYPAPAVGLPPWYRFATNGLLLRYIGGGGERYTNWKVAASRVFVGF